jgi:hypothetical protein
MGRNRKDIGAWAGPARVMAGIYRIWATRGVYGYNSLAERLFRYMFRASSGGVPDTRKGALGAGRQRQ